MRRTPPHGPPHQRPALHDQLESAANVGLHGVLQSGLRWQAGNARGRPGRPLSSFGDELRKQRELRQITLQEIAEATKVNLRFLEAMERDLEGAPEKAVIDYSFQIMDTPVEMDHTLP